MAKKKPAKPDTTKRVVRFIFPRDATAAEMVEGIKDLVARHTKPKPMKPRKRKPRKPQVYGNRIAQAIAKAPAALLEKYPAGSEEMQILGMIAADDGWEHAKKWAEFNLNQARAFGDL